MIDYELTFNKLWLMSRFQIVFFLHIVYSPEFVNLSLVEITYIMNKYQELDKTVKVSSVFYINIYLANIYYFINILEIDLLLSYFMLCFQVGFVLTLVDERSSWRKIKKYKLILENLEFEDRMSFSIRL